MTFDPNFQSGSNLKHSGSSLADEVIARHWERVVPGRSRYAESVTAGASFCRLCNLGWPCDAYRLAVIVRDIDHHSGGHPMKPYKIVTYGPGAAEIEDRFTGEVVGSVILWYPDGRTARWDAYATHIGDVDDVSLEVGHAPTRAEAAALVWEAHLERTTK